MNLVSDMNSVVVWRHDCRFEASSLKINKLKPSSAFSCYDIARQSL